LAIEERWVSKGNKIFADRDSKPTRSARKVVFCGQSSHMPSAHSIIGVFLGSLPGERDHASTSFPCRKARVHRQHRSENLKLAIFKRNDLPPTGVTALGRCSRPPRVHSIVFCPSPAFRPIYSGTGIPSSQGCKPCTSSFPNDVGFSSKAI